MKFFETKVIEKNKKLFHVQYFYFTANRDVCENVENTVEPDKPQMTIKYGACALHAGHLRHLNYPVHLLQFINQ